MEKIPDNSILVTMDVRSLYTNILNKEGIEAVETTLKRKNILNEDYLDISPVDFNSK